MTRKVTYWSGVIGVLLFVIAVVLGGLQFESYSHISQFISESYAFGTPYGEQLRYFAYIPCGICFFLFGLFASRFLPNIPSTKLQFNLFAIFYGIGTIVVSVFPCDEGCNLDWSNVSLSQMIHNIAGALVYLIVPITIVWIGLKSKAWQNMKQFSKSTLLLGTVAFLFSLLLFALPESDFIGLIQRIIEGAILLWILFSCNYINNLAG